MFGTIVSWFDKRGFGFIRPDDSTEEVFVHISDFPNRQPLQRNARVKYEIGSFGGRTKAIKVGEVSR